LNRRFAPYQWLDMLGIDGLIKGWGGEVRQATSELASHGADLSVEVAIVGIDDLWGLGNDLGTLDFEPGTSLPESA